MANVLEILRKLVNNSNFAQTLADKICTLVFVFGGIFTIWYELNILYFYYNDNLISTWPAIHFIIGTWVYIAAMTNWYKLIATRTFAYYVELQPKQESHWKYCSSCFGFAPPRAHHCKICNVCILKRDHHCWFAGTCVGYHNHRYYFAMLVYIFIAAVYSNIFNFSFVMQKLEGGVNIGTGLCLIFPHGAALLGYLSLNQFLLCVVSLTGFVCCVMFTWLLQIQISQLFSGLTKYEKANTLPEYRRNFKYNLDEILGKHKIRVLLCAFLSSELPGDGMCFPKETKHDQ